MLSRSQVVDGTAEVVRWWLSTRLTKFKDLSHESMAINPFMAPVLMALHSHQDFDELAELLLGGHFMSGHSTGFGKLIDEKLLPTVFGTRKLDKEFRRTSPYDLSLFDEVDHVVGSGDEAEFLSLKSSRWTIQLSMAMRLNAAFTKLVELRAAGQVQFRRIVVGVIYGKPETMTDKYSIIRGICSGATHDVTDIQEHVEVVAGRGLWTWLNGGEAATQDWIVDGILEAIQKSKTDLVEANTHLAAYKAKFAENFRHHVSDGRIDWHAIVREING